MGSSAVGGGDSLAPIVRLAMGAQGFRDDASGSIVGIGEGTREGWELEWGWG